MWSSHSVGHVWMVHQAVEGGADQARIGIARAEGKLVDVGIPLVGNPLPSSSMEHQCGRRLHRVLAEIPDRVERRIRGLERGERVVKGGVHGELGHLRGGGGDPLSGDLGIPERRDLPDFGDDRNGGRIVVTGLAGITGRQVRSTCSGQG